MPTLEQAGLPGFRAALCCGIMAPGGTPEPILDFCARHIAVVLAMPGIAQRLGTLGIEAETGTPAALGALLPEDNAALGQVIREAGIRAD